MHVVSQLYSLSLELPAIECAVYMKVEIGKVGQ